MKKFVLLIVLIFFCMPVMAEYKYLRNNLKNTKFIFLDYLGYDLNSFNYDSENDLYSVDVINELDPGGDLENINCKYSKGYITHLIHSTKYSPRKDFFKVEYKGYVCSVVKYRYKNFRPISAEFKYKGVFYDNDTSIIPNYNMEYFDYLKKEITNPSEYNYFGSVQKIRKNNTDKELSVLQKF